MPGRTLISTECSKRHPPAEQATGTGAPRAALPSQPALENLVFRSALRARGSVAGRWAVVAWEPVRGRRWLRPHSSDLMTSP
jgi:hypothetical protein